MRLPYFTLPFLLILLSSCSTTSGDGNDTRNTKDPEDQPMSVSLGQQLVARRKETISSSTSSPLFMEGGSINKTTQVLPAAAEEKGSMSPSNTTHNILPAEGAMAVSWPEGQDKNSSIKPRKGVSTNIDDIGSITATPCSCCVNITSEALLKNCSCCPPDFKINPSTTKPTEITVNATSKTVKETVVVSTTSTSTSTAAPPVPLDIVPSPIIHHHKPNVTADVPDQQVPAQKEDYVIPVVGIIFAIPLAIILGALVYKKGADLWERRHYRRMDFLIDGIYNQ